RCAACVLRSMVDVKTTLGSLASRRTLSELPSCQTTLWLRTAYRHVQSHVCRGGHQPDYLKKSGHQCGGSTPDHPKPPVPRSHAGRSCKCRTDFDVEIDLGLDSIRDRNAKGWSTTHCVVGRIHYLNVPRRSPNGRVVPIGGYFHHISL